jgi:D-alanine-D-alanine ligase
MSIRVAPDWWKKLFDEVYLTTDARSVCNDDLTRREVDVFCELLPLLPAHRILDLCGGHGRHTLELCRRGFTRCTVLDYSETLLRRGAANALKNSYPVMFVRGDARRSGLKPESHEHVLVLGNSLGYGPDTAADLQILAEALRVLKPKGWLLLDVTDAQAVKARFTPNAWHEIGAEFVICRHREIDGDVIYAREMILSKTQGLIRDKTYNIRLYSQHQLTSLATGAGFADVRTRTGFKPHCCQGDFGFMNQRMLLTARKI